MDGIEAASIYTLRHYDAAAMTGDLEVGVGGTGGREGGAASSTPGLKAKANTPRVFFKTKSSNPKMKETTCSQIDELDHVKSGSIGVDSLL